MTSWGLMASGAMTVLDAAINLLGALVLIFDDNDWHRLYVGFAIVPECSFIKVVSVILGLVFGIRAFADETFSTVQQNISGGIGLTSTILEVSIIMMFLLSYSGCKYCTLT